MSNKRNREKSGKTIKNKSSLSSREKQALWDVFDNDIP